jgi:hypothetical protein
VRTAEPVASQPDQGLEIALPELLGGVAGLERGHPDGDGILDLAGDAVVSKLRDRAARDDVILPHSNVSAATCLKRFLPLGWHFPATVVDEDHVGQTRPALGSGRVDGRCAAESPSSSSELRPTGRLTKAAIAICPYDAAGDTAKVASAEST